MVLMVFDLQGIYSFNTCYRLGVVVPRMPVITSCIHLPLLGATPEDFRHRCPSRPLNTCFLGRKSLVFGSDLKSTIAGGLFSEMVFDFKGYYITNSRNLPKRFFARR